MTGFGSAQSTGEGPSVAVEIRAVNNRHLKVSVRGTDPYPLHEADFEKLVRTVAKRGTVTIHLRVARASSSLANRIDMAVLEDYLGQLRNSVSGKELKALLPGVLALPGVVPDAQSSVELPEEEWAAVQRTTTDALKAFNATRRREGQAMADELLRMHGLLESELRQLREHLARVAVGYRERLAERVRQAVGASVPADQLIREVALFAERSDIAEETTRAAAHLEQFAEVVRKGSNDSAGRRLEFLAQELGREVNTMGSKAGDAAVSRHAVEMKAVLEQVRELVLNLE